MDTLEKSCLPVRASAASAKAGNTAYEWILKWYPLIISDELGLPDKDLVGVSQTDRGS